MAEIQRYPFFRHFRSEPSCHVLRYRRGKLLRSGKGLSFWFRPMITSIAEIPIDDRDLPILFHSRTKDFQDVTVQGVVTYRVADPEMLARRFDFSVDLHRGTFLREPLDQIATLLTGMAQQHASRHVAASEIRPLLCEGLSPIQNCIDDGLKTVPELPLIGIEVVSVRVGDVSPTSELEKALQTPTREELQQQADEATFHRRALAVENERAIAENELQNQIELARREESLIAQRGQNGSRRAKEEAEAHQIASEAKASRSHLESRASAERIRMVGEAKVETEKERVDIYRTLSSPVLAGLAAQEFAGRLQSIEHLNITPDLLGPVLTNLLQAGARHLEPK